MKLEVFWTENHHAYVEADNEEEAVEKAMRELSDGVTEPIDTFMSFNDSSWRINK